METFNDIAKRARQRRDKESCTALLNAYANMDCATYPIDSALFGEVFPQGCEGFILTPYLGLGQSSHTIGRIEQ